MDGKLNRTREAVADTLGIPLEVALDIPKIIIDGNYQIVIENHKGLKAFDENMVVVNSKLGSITLKGRDFKVLFIGGNTLTIGGILESVGYFSNEN